MEMLEFDREKTEKFRKAYSLAKIKQNGSKTFLFEGHEFVLDYAKYLLEYLEDRYLEGRWKIK